ncbi:hypothetical protein GCM10010917_27430 [Paenibacillus physcomitrellae]|uniref:HTH tetR-type domain-containing protein n=1 Tax=Paenibacillus physcomitrellae TaxID=1619311 RepID=A0ABQ1GBU7_9BACL|nr:hypothetical protein GCM10010917_27430 [Paenibacillus physcomitrellae]
MAGASASTIKIAKKAGVAEGILFVYFPTKDDLLNQLFLDLKSDLMGFIIIDYPIQGPSRRKSGIYGNVTLTGEQPMRTSVRHCDR